MMPTYTLLILAKAVSLIDQDRLLPVTLRSRMMPTTTSAHMEHRRLLPHTATERSASVGAHWPFNLSPG